MLTLVAILVDGLIYASWLFMVAAGLTLIYGVMKILNMAHGSLFAIGAYTSAWLAGWYFTGGGNPTWGYLLMLGGAIVAGGLVGFVIERGLLRFLYGRDPVVMILLTYAVLLILEDVIKLVWGVDPYFAFQPYTLLGRTQLGPLTFSNYDFGVILIAAIIGVGLWWGLNRTRFGKLLLAVIHDREMSVALGIDVRTYFMLTFVIGSILGCIAGAVTAPSLSVAPGIGVEVIVLAFAVVVIGGLGSVGGALVGALIVGFTRATAVHLLPQVELFVIFGVMSLVLVVRPQGLFRRAQPRKI
jgi:branched-chain amino acid transport system permease protein